MNNRELLTVLDACRPSSAEARSDGDVPESPDLQLPELAAGVQLISRDPDVRQLFIRLQNFDRATALAMHAVQVPAGLEARLLSALQAETPNTEMLHTVELQNPIERTAPVVQQFTGAGTRRRFLRSVAALAASVAVIAGAWFAWPRDRVLNEGQLVDSYQWHDRVSGSTGWLPLAEEHWTLIPREIAGHRNGYRDATEVVGRDALAFDLTVPGTAKATLFVIEQPQRAGLPAEAPRSPQSRTLGYSVGFFERDGSIYVLVVESESLRDYQRYIDQGRFLPAA